jgi:hypothetical protein
MSDLYPNHQAETLTLGHMVLAGDAAEIAKQYIKKHWCAALAIQGPRAFEEPKSSAVVHEAGHAVLYAHHEIKVRYVKVWRQKSSIEQDHWVGKVKTTSIFHTGPDTSPEDDFKNACILFAGRTAEELFDADNLRLGSSLDEVVHVQLLAHNISQKTGVDPNEIIKGICAATVSILKENEDVVREIASLIDRKGITRGKELQSILAKVAARAHPRA